MPKWKFPLKAASILGFDAKQVAPSLIVQKIGNTYSGSSLLGLAAVLDRAKPGERVLMTSYGSGAGSDSFSITVTDQIEERRRLAPPVQYYIETKSYLNYSLYAKNRRLFRE
jgi:hydroxymethylglutaryl-CoA synthase